MSSRNFQKISVQNVDSFFNNSSKNITYNSSSKNITQIEEADDFESEESLNGDFTQIYDNVSSLVEVRRAFGITADNDEEEVSGKEKQNDQMLKDYDYFVLFLDPESLIYYRKIIGRDDFIRLEPMDDKRQGSQSNTPMSNRNLDQSQEITIKEKFEMNNKKALVSIIEMLLLPGFSWTFVGEAESYRRRPFPLKFLQYECSNYPCYVFSSELSKAFNTIAEIPTEVDLSEFSNIIKQRDKSNQKTYIYKSNESLVASTKEFIKNILRHIYINYNGTKILPEEGSVLSLKVDGYREYLTGNYQLLQYERVRQSLRKNVPLKLILTKIDLNHRDKFFPALFKMDKSITYPINHVKQYQMKMQAKLMQDNNLDKPPEIRVGVDEAYTILEKQRYNRGHDLINFEDLEFSQQYFWYSPVPNLQLKENQLNQKKQSQLLSNSFMADRQSLKSNHGLTQKDKVEMNWVDVPLQKEQISISKHRFLSGGTTQPRADQQIVVNSGEINWGFKFKIISLERINKIFEEIQNPVATDNLETEPRNVTLNHKKVINKNNNKEKKKQPKKATGEGHLEEVREQADSGITSQSQYMATDATRSDYNPSSVDQAQGQKQFKNVKEIVQSAQAISFDYDLPKILSLSTKNNRFRLQSEKDAKSGDPYIIEQHKMENKIKEIYQVKNFKKILHKKMKNVDSQIIKEFERYKKINFKMIKSPFCNFADACETLECYKNILRFSIGSFTPLKIKIQCDLFHGCEKLVETQVVQETFFSNNIYINRWCDFGNLRYCQLPVKTRLSINVILVFKEAYELTIGCVSMNLFDEKKRFMSGVKDLNIWPFYEIDERLGCMKEYKGRRYDANEDRDDLIRNIHNEFTKIVLEFESFILPMYYSSRDINQINLWKLTKNEDDINDESQMLQNDIRQINIELAQLKKCFAKNPLSPLTEEEKLVLFRTREHYQTYPQGLPWFLRSVQWHRPLLVNETYKMLKNWAPMEPEEAISLLDAKFPDERVRSYAVERLKNLSDDDLALYMLQFSQALLYEEGHYSPLSDMLIERSLKNPYVVGQSFFWSLKSNLYLKTSYERYYLLLEQFLMLCGKFRSELQIQIKVNQCLQTVQENIMINRYGFLEKKEHPWQIYTVEEDDEEGNGKKKKEKLKFNRIKENAKLDLLRLKQNKFPFLFNLTIDPKSIIKDFVYEEIRVFNSKKVPMLVCAQNAQPGGSEIKAMFKNGDDLRQDILTLQIISVMDKIWLAHNLDLKMTPYKVIGTHCMQGFLEYVPKSKTLAAMQYEGKIRFITDKGNVFNTFSNDSISRFMYSESRNRIKKKMEKENENSHFEYKIDEKELNQRVEEDIAKIRKVFAKSTAGYCVASYILGLGDRHPDNIMINTEEGNFLHIDFGHFLGNVKAKFGVKRERDPFVLTPEIADFINGKSPTEKSWFKRQIDRRFGRKSSSNKKRNVSSASKRTESQHTTFAGFQNTTSPQKDGNDSASEMDLNFQDQDEYGSADEYDEFVESGMSPEKKFQNQSVEESARFEDESEHLVDGYGNSISQNDINMGNKQENNSIYKSQDFQEFEENCCVAYNILRKEGNKLINLFLLMLSAGMPELSKDKHLEYLVEKLNLHMSEQEASKHFKKEIQRAIKCTSRRIDNFAHNIKAVHL